MFIDKSTRAPHQMPILSKTSCCQWCRNDPLNTLRKAKASILFTAGVSVSQELVRVIMETRIYSRKKVLVHARPSSIEIETATAFLERSDRHEEEEHRFVFSSRCDLLQTRQTERVWVFEEQDTGCMQDRAQRERRHHHLFYLQWIHLPA